MDTQRRDASDAPRILAAVQALAPHIRDAADTIPPASLNDRERKENPYG